MSVWSKRIVTYLGEAIEKWMRMLIMALCSLGSGLEMICSAIFKNFRSQRVWVILMLAQSMVLMTSRQLQARKGSSSSNIYTTLETMLVSRRDSTFSQEMSSSAQYSLITVRHSCRVYLSQMQSQPTMQHSTEMVLLMASRGLCLQITAIAEQVSSTIFLSLNLVTIYCSMRSPPAYSIFLRIYFDSQARFLSPHTACSTIGWNSEERVRIYAGMIPFFTRISHSLSIPHAMLAKDQQDYSLT